EVGSGSLGHLSQSSEACARSQTRWRTLRSGYKPVTFKPCTRSRNGGRTPSMTGNDNASSRPTVADGISSAAIEVDRLVKVDKQMRLTVRQNLTIFGKLYAVRHLADRIAKLADDLDLTDFIDRANGKLSAGQKTRVALAKALINQPELLLLDEPTASLDPDTADWVREHLETYRKTQQATILLASHNMFEVERLCDRVIIMKRGRIEDDDSP